MIDTELCNALGTFRAVPAWTTAEIHAGVERLVAGFGGHLPGPEARVLIKPNLNNDLVALTGNSADLRVLEALLAALRRRGYHDLTVADGSNVGVHRRGIDAARRLRLDRLLQRHGARWLDLNEAPGVVLPLRGAARVRVARAVLEAELLISVPKIKTHAEAGFSCAMKNWVGLCAGQDKREVHRALGPNIHALNLLVRPHLVLVDGVVGMEGNGPGDGDPVRLGLLAACDSTLLNDLAICRLVGVPWTQVSYLRAAAAHGDVDGRLQEEIARALPQRTALRRPPPRSALAELSEHRALGWLKRAVRPLVEQPAVAEAAYRAGIIQDVYSRQDDTVTGFTRDAGACGDCRRCEDFCPTALPLEDIGREPARPDCVQCLYCWWVCPREAITLSGELGHLERQVARYKGAVERL